MSKVKGLSGKYFDAILWLAVFVAVVSLIIRNINTFGNILLTLIGFGAVVLVHEFGHFIFAKLTGIKVEAFSIGFPPTLVGILREEKGWRIRILPRVFGGGEEASEGGLSFTIGKKAHRPGETEYRIGIIPIGGFVKMLGQEDIGSVKASDDPRSYANKPVSARVAVIAAGVVFNAISALIVFMIVFLVGINRVPAVVGGVVADSPAARAGLSGGDEIIEIAGRSEDLDYYDIAVTAALSGKNEKVALMVRHEDGSVEDYKIAAEQEPGDEVKQFGILIPQSLIVAEVSDVNELFEATGLRPGDQIKSVNGRDVRTYWEMERVVEDSFVPEVTILAERTGKDGGVKLVESQIPLDLSFGNREPQSESELGHIYSVVPRLRVKVADTEIGLKEGDIILSAGDIENPTYKEIRDITREYKGKELSLEVLRGEPNGAENVLTVNVVPKRSQNSGRVLIGFFAVFDAEHPVVAKMITAEGGLARLDIPRGAVITSVDGVSVSDFYEIVREIRRCTGESIAIDYRMDDGRSGSVVLDVKAGEGFITVKPVLADFIPFKSLERLYKADGPVDAMKMGYRKTVMFIAQAYITLKGLVTGLFSPKSLMGPVGIISLSYTIVAERPLIDYVYFLGLISAMLAVFNVLPLLPFDGGHIVFLFVEKIKGSPINERVQEKIASVGWVLVVALILYVTFNDIVRSFFS